MTPDRGFTWRSWANGPRRGIAPLAALVMVLATALPATASTTYDPSLDPYSMASLTSQMGAADWWNAGYTGAGVDVALIDSGLSPVAGLDAPGKVIYGPDLSLESQAPNLTYLDTFGHGTFMAGLIAGHDATLTAPYAAAPPDAYRGIAPDARIVSLKVATADGGADVTQVIAAIDWVIEHRRDNGLNVRVINLSYGTNSTQAYTLDPLSYAVERAWKQGIVVVASAGNAGYQKGSGAACLADPAYNPFVIGVGGVDTMGTASYADDQVATYSSSGAPKCKNPDFVTPGSHLQGLRDPSSFIDANHPEGLLGTRYFRGSGTSEAAAITSGAIALVLQRYPDLTPDQVKRFFTANASQLKGMIGFQQGAGELRLKQMLTTTPPAYSQGFTASSGAGSIELARGQDHLTRNGVVLRGEQDVFGATVSSTSLASAEASGNTWAGGSWNGNTWAGNTWAGNTWAGNTWAGSAWDGNTWAGNTWTGNTWAGNTWTGNTWAGASWSGSAWTGNSWASDSWN